MVLSHLGYSTHNRGGEITYRHIAGYTYEVTITTCTDVGPGSQTDRDELQIEYGDGQLDTLPRISQTVMLPPYQDYQKNVYRGIHTYSSPGTYVLTMEDPNRNANIQNIHHNTPASSDDVVFALEAMLIIDPFAGNSGANNSVIFDDCPCPEIACSGKSYCYNPLAVDPDGDSLGFELVAPLGANALPLSIPTVYQFPHLINGGGSSLSIDPVTGTMCWDTPTTSGEFNVTIKITEYRNGHKVGHTLRDIQLTVESACTNDPPVIVPVPDTCVIAGSSISFDVVASDINNNSLELIASGLPLNVTNPATFTGGTGQSVVTGTFTWNTDCNHIQADNYDVLFSVQDNGDPDFSDYESFSIRVIPPALTTLSATAFGNGVVLNWDAATCSNAEGYRIYRTTNPNTVIPDCCGQTDLSLYGYDQIGEIFGINNTTFTDYSSLNLGIDYCYRVTAFYNFGQVESCASDTSCASLKKEVPLITHVTIDETSPTTGVDSVMWSKATELDTAVYPGPYHYKVYAGTNLNNANTLVGQTSPSASYATADTTLVLSNLDTESAPLYYRVELYYTNNGNDSLVGTSNSAGSVFLATTPSDNAVTLSWNEEVPWINDLYHVYRALNSSGPFNYIGSTTNQTYLDSGLINGVEYCYYVMSSGYYSSPSVINPILNRSQIKCDIPIDETPPCPPVLSIDGDCQEGVNVLTWNNPNNTCADDVMSYNIYYTPIQGEPMELLATITTIDDTTFTHTNDGSGAGCYVVTATDSVQYGNESDSSNVVCFDNCPYYWLPNVFTPNGDGSNDFFTALEPYYHIESIDMHIYNRWGEQVFHTTDPDVKWDGIHMKSGNPATDGVYYYHCTLYTIRLTGIDPVNIKGFIHLFGQSEGTNTE